MSESDRKQKRKRRPRNGVIEIANALLTLVVIGIVVLGGVLLFGVNQFNAPGPLKQETAFLVEKGSSLRLIGERLANQGIIDNQLIFQGGGWVMKKQGQLKPGEFTIPAGASMSEVMALLTEGKPREYFLMVNPGETSWEVAQKLNAATVALTGDPVPVPPEGSVLPVRHDYFPRDSRADVLRNMQTEMEKAVDAAWAKCLPTICGPEAPLKTKKDLVIMASIVEEETGLAAERPIVAGLFLNRLRRGMPLQTDPTILYGLFKGVTQESRVITESQIRSDTPFNTYVIPALPPTPISNPGVAALEAVATAPATDFIYMMAVTPGDYSDGHAFAVTLDEHNANKAKYDRLAREQARSPAADAPATEAAPQ